MTTTLEMKAATVAQFGSALAVDLDEADAICRLLVSRGHLPGIASALSWKTGLLDYVVEVGPPQDVADTI